MQIFYENKEKLISGINFYTDIHNKINDVTDMNKLLEVIKFFLIDNETSEHMQNEFNIVQALMKICIHKSSHYKENSKIYANAYIFEFFLFRRDYRIWQLCYDLHPRLRKTPEEALNDIIDPIGASQKNLFDLVQMMKDKK